MTHEEAIKVAALAASTELHYVTPSRMQAAISAYLQAIGFEPVAWQIRVKGDEEWTVVPLPSGYSDRYELRPLFSAPPAPARDEEIERLTRELEEAEAERDHFYALAVDDPGQNPPAFWKRRAEAAEAQLAALLSERAGSGDAVRVKIKALEWAEICVDGETFWRARKPFGSAYYIQLLSNGRFDWKDEFETLDEAKAAAQADYETRIRSALTVDSDRPATGKEGELIRDLPDRATEGE